METDKERGISLDIDDASGEVKIADSVAPTNECFGNVQCEFCETNCEEHRLKDGTKITLSRLWCAQIQKSVIDIFHEGLNARCPLDRWIKAAAPKHYGPA